MLSITNSQIIDLSIKLFGIVFALLYLIFSISFFNQVKILYKTIETTLGSKIYLYGLFQGFFSLLVFLLAFFLL